MMTALFGPTLVQRRDLAVKWDRQTRNRANPGYDNIVEPVLLLATALLQCLKKGIHTM